MLVMPFFLLLSWRSKDLYWLSLDPNWCKNNVDRVMGLAVSVVDGRLANSNSAKSEDWCMSNFGSSCQLHCKSSLLENDEFKGVWISWLLWLWC